MKISSKARFAATLMFGTMVLIAVSIAWADAQVRAAVAQRRHSVEIAGALNNMRMVTFEYLLHRRERARLQEQAVWERLERLFANPVPFEGEAVAMLASLRSQGETSHRLFREVDAAAGSAAEDEIQRRFEAQLSSHILILQQNSLVDAEQLIDDAGARIDATQQRVVLVTGIGLLVMAILTGVAAWWLRRDVLAPIARLEMATREVAAGNWSFELDVGSADELGDMARHFDAMTRALRESFGQLEVSNRALLALNQELESFSYSVSHDLRSPLRSMDGFSLALLEDYGDKLDEEARDSLQRIRGASQRMGRLIDELLGLARVTRAELRLQDVDLSALAREIAATLTRTQPERRARWEIEEGLVVRGDRELLAIAFQNLLENAWKFTGKVEDAVIRVGTRQEDGRRVCFVADNGAGFDMAYASRLFGAFQRLHHEADFPGTGVGLAIVQRVMRRHGWSLGAQASLGQGATFYFCPTEQDDEQRREQGDPAG
ncbi:HAMP domain-containing histidine kinase [Pelomonas sp. KK5]|uniref:HAMP domain-containing histidine kinase n=1 Tax=Pelomonas sp. KK5 TaxID=1855730 RepID=UPI00097BC792|nr:HAMP domain-containing histidine kinase [Pelomonas sp. KK5]